MKVDIENAIVENIVSEAKKDKRKGSYSAYEYYKRQLFDVCRTSLEYQSACQDIAKALRV